MDTELLNALASISAQVSEVARVTSETKGHVLENSARVERLEFHVFGSKPPAPMPKPPPPGATIRGRLGSAEHTDQEHANRLARVEGELFKQSRAMGLPADGARPKERWHTYLASRAGRSFVLKLVTLIVTALGLVASIRAGTKASHAADKVDAAPAAALERNARETKKAVP